MESSHVSLADLAVHIGDDLSVNLHSLCKARILRRVVLHSGLQDLLRSTGKYLQILLCFRRETHSFSAELVETVEHVGDMLCHLRVVIDRIVEEDQIMGILVLHSLLRDRNTIFAQLRRVATCLVAEKPCLCQLFLGIVPD